MTTFTVEQTEQIRAILANPAIRSDEKTNYTHFEHCLWQMWRFAHLASKGETFRTLQFGMNLGRAQEIVMSIGGVECWWRAYAPLVETSDWAGIIKKASEYCTLLGTEWPELEFLEKK